MSACSSAPVADDVSQREANEIVALLNKRNISSSLVKARGGKGRYSVVVQESDFPSAAEVLSGLGLPAEKKPSFQELTGGNGIIPPSREVEALRLDRAIASELEDLFRARRDVASASAMVRIYSREANERSAVTVVVQRAGSSKLDTSEVLEIAKRALPGIQSEDVFVSISGDGDAAGSDDSAAKPSVPFLGLWRVPAEAHSGLVSLVVSLVAVSAALAGLGGYIFGQFNLLRKQGPLGPSKASRSSPASSDIAGQGASSTLRETGSERQSSGRDRELGE